jgi:L-aminopeptidase/D-esterase-like protein
VSAPPLVPGLRVGHATDEVARTGCTVLLGPFRAAAHVAGMATGSRELETLSPLHVAPTADAILFAGGAAFGLAAADGVMAWLEERGEGFDTGIARVPIVPAAVVFDLGVGRSRPDAAMGRLACDAASADHPAEVRVGAGTGATVGKLLGPGGADAGGFGCVSVSTAGCALSALVVVNALGDVLDSAGRPIAGARAADGSLAGSARLLRESTPASPFDPPPAGTATTLAAVITDAPLDWPALLALAQMATTALARRIEPVHTPFDGDIVFAASTSAVPSRQQPAALLALGAVATHALCEAIERAVSPR